MDHLADFLNFKRLVMRLCVTFDKFATDELIETWWKVLKDQRFRELESRVDAFIASAEDKTKFPKPSKFLSSPYVSDAERGKYDHAAEQSKKNWREHIERFQTTGPIQLKMAMAARVMASEYEGSLAYSEAEYEYRALEKQLGHNGRFAADR